MKRDAKMNTKTFIKCYKSAYSTACVSSQNLDGKGGFYFQECQLT